MVFINKSKDSGKQIAVTLFEIMGNYSACWARVVGSVVGRVLVYVFKAHNNVSALTK